MNVLPENHLLMKLAAIAREAGDIILEYFKAPSEVFEKADGSPVTRADQEAEKHIINALHRIYPDIPCIGEESAQSADHPSRLERYWCIDPLDGTREFINDRPEFTVNIALVENGYPTAGVIYAPALNILYIGSLETGSYRSDRPDAFLQLPIYVASKPFTVVISRMHPTAGAEQVFLEKIKKEYTDVDVQILGSSLKFCMVADGSADIYFRAGRTMFWDSAAGHIIAKAAGNKVVNWESQQELIYSTDTLENPAFLVYNPDRVKEIL